MARLRRRVSLGRRIVEVLLFRRKDMFDADNNDGAVRQFKDLWNELFPMYIDTIRHLPR